MLKVLVVEDELLSALELKKMLKAIRPSYIVTKHLSSIEELKLYFKTNPSLDLMFLDIELQDGNSLEKIKKLHIQTPIIYCTAYSQYAIEAFDTNAIGYLLKPFSQLKLLEVIEKFEETRSYIKEKAESDNTIFIQSEYKRVQISIDDILYLESLNDYIHIHLKGNKSYSTLLSMKKMMEKLPANKFVRIHRSYIVPLFRIQFVKGKIVSLGYKELPLGITYENEFYKQYLKENY